MQPGRSATNAYSLLSGFFDDDCEFHQFDSFQPACLRMLLQVPGAMSSFGFPAGKNRAQYETGTR